MKIQSASAYADYPYLNISTNQNQAPANGTVNFSASGATISDTVAISQAARNYLADQSNFTAPSENCTTAVFDTNQGAKKLNIDAYFSPSGNANGTSSLFQTLPPLLLPSKNNIDAIANHISETFTQFLVQNNIPSAPSSITYDNEGKIQLPADYAYASAFKQALANNPTMSRELSTANALTSHYVGMQKSLEFQQEYAATTTKAEANAVVARYSYLFSGYKHYDTIALHFSESGRLNLTHDGESLF
ncbi:hypothetical protein [Desulfotignum balticum]|uniref:hypothetical protein n=1 Tax=Desulfotignum balticum TaxID=115781 RepID=UPI0003FFE67B|nr:hypothetical protein [Desulfotignum balticum]